MRSAQGCQQHSLIAPSFRFDAEPLAIFIVHVMMTCMLQMVILVLLLSSCGMSVPWQASGIIEELPRAIVPCSRSIVFPHPRFIVGATDI